MKNKLWVWGSGTVILALAVAFLIIFVQPRLPDTARLNQPPVLGDGQTARQAYTVLEVWAKDWAADTQLVTVSNARVKQDTGGTGWTFQVYAPSKQQIAIVLVDQKKVWVLREQIARYAQSPVPVALWSIDSQTALTQWWQADGAHLWAQPYTQGLYLRLAMQADGVPAWQLNVLNTAGDLAQTWAMRADTGAVLRKDDIGDKQ